MAFHEVRFPSDISKGAQGGPRRRTEIVMVGSGFEERNQRWADSRRFYDAAYGIHTGDDIYAVLEFFEERRGRFHGFRWKDHGDYKSCYPSDTIAFTDQTIGTGDGSTVAFQLTKQYGLSFAPYSRNVKKPVSGTVLIGVAGVLQTETTDYTVDHTTGIITFTAGSIPSLSAAVTAGYEFDVPARFDTDDLIIQYEHEGVATIDTVPIAEIRI